MQPINQAILNATNGQGVPAAPNGSSSPSPYKPGKDPLKIGTVTFNSIECPADLPIGAVEQKTVVTEYIGGGRVTQSMGVQPQQVSWKGVFLDTMVALRVKALRAMCVAGQEYLLAWRDEQYYCKVIKFTPTYKNANLAEYEITVEVTRDANGALKASSATSIDQQVSALMSDAQSQYAAVFAVDPGISVVQPDLSNMNLTIQNAGPLAKTAGTSAASILGSIQKALTSVNNYLATIGKNSPALISATRLSTVLNLLYKNVQRGQNPQSVRVMGTDLFAMAAQKYGNVLAAFALAQANGLNTPLLPAASVKDIVLPPLGSN